MKQDSLLESIVKAAKPRFCGTSNIILYSRVKVINQPEPLKHLNGVIGTAVHPPDWGDGSKGWIGIVVDKHHLSTTLSSIINVHEDNVTFVHEKQGAAIRPNVNLGASFETLKTELKKTVDIDNPASTPQRVATDLGRLQSAVKRHLLECTNITGEELQKDIEKKKDHDPDDLKGVNI